MPSKKANVSVIIEPEVHQILKEFCKESETTVSSFIAGILEESAPRLKYLTKEIRKVTQATENERKALIEKYSDVEKNLYNALKNVPLNPTTEENNA